MVRGRKGISGLLLDVVNDRESLGRCVGHGVSILEALDVVIQ